MACFFDCVRKRLYERLGERVNNRSMEWRLTLYSIRLLNPTVQMTFKHYNPATKKATWKSVNVGSFKTDGRGCKSDHFVS